MSSMANDAQPIEVGLTAAGNIIPPLLPQTDIITRPWPRSVLPHGGNPGITVGFGDGARSAAPHNPFQLRTGIDNLPPVSLGRSDEQNGTLPADTREDGDADDVAENQPQPQS